MTSMSRASQLFATGALALLLPLGAGCGPTQSLCFAGQTSSCESLRQSCVDGHPAECTWLARSYWDGEGNEEDRVEALNLFASACRGDPQRCGEFVAAAGDLPARDLSPVAWATMRSACEGGLAVACRLLSLDPSLDPGSGLALLRQACDAGDATACDLSSYQLYQDGSRSAALEVASTGCALGGARSCLVAGLAAIGGAAAGGTAVHRAYTSWTTGAKLGSRRASLAKACTDNLAALDELLGVGGSECSIHCASVVGASSCVAGASSCLREVSRAPADLELDAADGLAVCRRLLFDCLDDQGISIDALARCSMMCAPRTSGRPNED